MMMLNSRNILNTCAALLVTTSLWGCNAVLGNKSPDDLEDTGTGFGDGGAGSGDGDGDTGSGDGDGDSGSGDGDGDGDVDNGCRNGTYDHDDNPNTVCQSWSKCDPGEYISEEGTSTSDRKCSACPSRTFSSSQNQEECTPHTECAPGEVVDARGTKTEDGTCEACPAGYTSEGGYADECSICPKGTFSSEPGAEECSACPQATFADVAGSTTCEPWSYCDWTEGLAEAPTAESDIECEAGSIYRSFDTAGYDYFYDIAVDADENVFAAGYSRGNVDDYEDYYYDYYACYYYYYWGGGDIPEECSQYDAVLIKYNRSGDVVWRRQWGTRDREYAYGVTVDEEGSAYVVGYTSGDFQGESAGGNDAFLVKFSPDGDQEMVKQFGTSTTDYARSVVVDSSGDIYVAGYTYGEIGDTTDFSGTSADMFVRKYSATGLTRWTHQFGGSGTDYAYSVDVDDEGFVYLGGYGSSDPFIGGASGDYDIVALRFDPDEETISPEAHRIGGSSTEYGYAIKAIGGGDYFIAGRYTLSTTVDSNTVNYYPGYVARRSFTSGTNNWTRYIYGQNVADDGSYSVYAYDLDIDESGDLIVAGYTNSITLNGIENPGSTSIFAVRLDESNSGSIQWAQFYGADDEQGTTSDYAYGVAFGPSGRAYVAGRTSGNLFGSGSAESYAGALIMVDVPELD